MDSSLSMPITFSLSCKGLACRDVLSRSDPFVQVFAQDPITRRWGKIGQTEHIDNDQNPSFVKSFEVDYRFEEVQQFKCKIFDWDKHTNHDSLGESTFTLANVMASRGQVLATKVVYNGRQHGTLTVAAEEKSGCNDLLRFTFRARKLDRKDGLFGMGKSDPFYVLSRSREDGSFIKAFSSEHINNNLNPKWKPASCSVAKLCNGDLHRPIKLEVFDWDDDGTHDLIGVAQVTVNSLLRCGQDEWIPLIHPPTKGKYRKKSYKNSGELAVTRAELVQQPSFIEYLKGGCEISLAVAVDYTGSNGNPANRNSLHFRGGAGNNQYQEAIASIGGILEAYDSDKCFPIMGFGGKVNNQVSHCFPLSGRWDTCSAVGVQGLLQAYASSFNTVQLSGPTLFSHVLQTVANMAHQSTVEESQQSQKYTVLLIITDGVINDMRETADQIVHASGLPLSVVIVGVGSADFSAMEVLDGDDKALRSSRGQICARDIVQFVPFLRYRGNAAALAKATLAEASSWRCGGSLVPQLPILAAAAAAAPPA